MNKRICLAVLLCVCAVVWFAPRDAGAIPAFARRYKISCSTCHAPFPRLKEYGEEFAGAGMIIAEEEKERDYISAGDDLMWLNRDFPIGVRFDVYAVYEQDAEAETDLQAPWGAKILSGGALSKGIGYYFYFYMSERGEVAGIEDAYIHFDDVGGQPLDFMVGQFQTSDPLMKRELRLTYEDYELYKTKIGDSHTNLTYDRGVMALYGIEKTGTDLVAMVVNGNGKDEATDERKYDGDKFKNVGFRLMQAVGEHVSVGGFAYLGKERMLGEDDVAHDNEVTYYGPDAVLSLGNATLTFQWLMRTDTDPDFDGVQGVDGLEGDHEATGMVAELVYGPQGEDGRHWLTLLYNQMDADDDQYDMERWTGSLSYLVKRNLRAVAEVTRDVEHERTRVAVGMVSGF